MNTTAQTQHRSTFTPTVTAGLALLAWLLAAPNLRAQPIVETPLYFFGNGAQDAVNPIGALTLGPDNALYGTTQQPVEVFDSLV